MADTEHNSSNSCQNTTSNILEYNTSSQCSSDEEDSSVTNNSRLLYILMALQIVLVFFIMTGNTLILLAIRQGKLMRKVTYYFIGNLAIADMLFGLALALRLLFVLTETLYTDTCLLIILISAVLGLSSGTGIVFLCLESFLAVRHYIVFKTGLTPKVACILIASSWLFWLLFCLQLLYHPDADEIPAAQCHFAHPFFNRIFLIQLWVIMCALIVTILVLQILTIYHIKKHVKGLLKQPTVTQSQTSTSKLTAGQTSSKTSTASKVSKQGKESEQQKRMLGRISAMSQITALILICFVLTWGPYTVALALQTMCPGCGVTGQHLMYIVLIVSLNSLANVFIFAVKSKDFKRAFRAMLYCRCRGGNQIEDIEQSVMT